MKTKKITKLPTPHYEVEAKVFRNGHIYTVNGEKYPSVTGILGIIGGGKTNALMVWSRRTALQLAQEEIYKAIDNNVSLTRESIADLINRADRQPDKVKDAAADLGTRVHEAIDAYILGQTPKLDGESAIGFQNFLDFLDHEKITMIAGDTPVASVKSKFGGRLDAIGCDEAGNLILLDWKTSNALRDEYPLQVGGYCLALEEQYGVKVHSAKVIRFDKTDPNVFEVGRVNLENAKDGFLQAVALTKTMKSALWANSIPF